MGNTKSNYERHEDDEYEQQRIHLGKDCRLIVGDIHFSKRKKCLTTQDQLSSSSNSSLASSFDDDPSPLSSSTLSVELISIDLPFVNDDTNELDIRLLNQYLTQQQSYGKELTHLYRIELNSKSKSRSLIGVYYDQIYRTEDFTIEKISSLNEETIAKFAKKTILSIYSTSQNLNREPQLFVISRKTVAENSTYKLIHSTETSDWLEPFVYYSKRGYRLCGFVENSSSLSWLFEEKTNCQYDHCVIEIRTKTFSLNKWKTFLNLMYKQQWKLVTIHDYYSQMNKFSILCFFQRVKQN